VRRSPSRGAAHNSAPLREQIEQLQATAPLISASSSKSEPAAMAAAFVLKLVQLAESDAEPAVAQRYRLP
jgi:hypothetical protein